MHLSLFALPAILYAQHSAASTLGIVDVGDQCMIWSNGNHGCTGYSSPFALPNEEDCSKLGGAVNGTSRDLPMVSVEACSTAEGLPAVWILLEKTGRVTFFNKQGNISACTLSDGLRVGSTCDAVAPEALWNPTLH
ncbi:uncharacterized protein N7506_005334 [Penicillium brevicompactum]|uniref:uncharacterized protein n=1 Tax=Penicillium brevicompactum TaxID=5074 RepID=UPI002540AE1F|nr:uncharacterized protein N7506_005334 [Penicillium brevicompactum]KAJ5337312.1 hypothetical protein N7506_005334 [Penicillium brevicompactum]